MKIKIILLFILGMVLISMVHAEVPIYQQNYNVTLTAVCENCTYVNLTKVENKNGIILLGQFPMTKNGTNYNYSLTNTSNLGLYNYITCGDLDGTLTCQDTQDRTFEITANGFNFSTAKSLIYITLLGILIFLFILNLIAIAKIPAGNPRADSGNILSISLVKYLKPTFIVTAWGLIISILFIASSIAGAYLSDQAFSKFLFGLFKLSTFFIYPLLIFWVIGIIINIVKDIKLNQLFGRGVIPQ